jgi:hypothetical protein
MLHNIIFTFFLGIRFLGGTREYWYASVDIILSGNLSATLLIKFIIDPLPIGEYKEFACVPYILLPGEKEAYFSSI